MESLSDIVASMRPKVEAMAYRATKILNAKGDNQ